jgi:hypothetical protein
MYTRRPKIEYRAKIKSTYLLSTSAKSSSSKLKKKRLHEEAPKEP